MRRFIALLAAASLLTACSHTVTIDSDPTGAEVRVNGEKIGNTPATYTETSGWDKAYQIELTKPGYKPVKKEIRQTDWNMYVIGGSAAAVICLIWIFPINLLGAGGLLFARQLPDRIVVPMERGSGGPSTSDPSTAPPSQYGY